MKKSTKIITVVLSTLVALSCVIIGVGTTMNNKDDTTTLPTVSTTKEQNSTVANTTTTEKPAESLETAILGKWTDSANMSGYEFFDDGTVEMTYVNLTVPVINIPLNGKAKGTYSLSGDKLTTKFSIYSASIDYSFKISVKGNELTMTDLEDLDTATYKRAEKEPESTAEATTIYTPKPSQNVTYDDEIIGSWISSDRETKYLFKEDGTAVVTLKNNAYSGIYMVDNGNITIQYAKASKKVTERFSYIVSKNILSFKTEKDETLFSREGTDASNVSEDDLLGVWRDGANMSGFEFKPDGIVEITYVNFTVPVINIPINGTYTGSYTVSGNKLTVVSTIAGTSIKLNYTYTLSQNTLTLTNTDEGTTSTYIKQ